jgi:hypothetical protein
MVVKCLPNAAHDGVKDGNGATNIEIPTETALLLGHDELGYGGRLLHDEGVNVSRWHLLLDEIVGPAVVHQTTSIAGKCKMDLQKARLNIVSQFFLVAELFTILHAKIQNIFPRGVVV